MRDGDGAYYPSHGPWPARLKKTAVALVGFGAVGAGAYFATTLIAGPPHTTPLDAPGALAPVAPATSTPAPQSVPAPGPQPGTKAALRVAKTQSPTPSISAIADDDIASAQVSRLVQAPPPQGDANIDSVGGGVMVTTETGLDGSIIHVLSAHYDLTARWALLAIADNGDAVGDARCSHRLLVGPAQVPTVRPGMLVCWRATEEKGVVTVAVGSVSSPPQAAASVAALDQEWESLG